MHNSIDKKLIKVAIVVLIILGIISIALIKVMEEKQREQLEISARPKLSELKQEDSKYIYQYFDELINQLFKNIQENNGEALISLLNKNYIKENNLNKQNVLEYFKQYEDISKYKTEEVYTQRIEQVQSYKGEYNYIRASITRNQQKENVYFLISQDLINLTFNLRIITEQTFNEIKETKSSSNSIDLNIEKNNYNGLD